MEQFSCHNNYFTFIGAIVTVSMETQSMETIDANLQHFDNETILTRFSFENKQLITPSRWLLTFSTYLF